MPIAQMTSVGGNQSVDPSERQAASQDARETKANSTMETNSLAPLVTDADGQQGEAKEGRRRSWFHRKSAADGVKDEEKKEKRKSISDSGPYIFVYDPNLGKEVMRKNPHWPNEDSWKRVDESKGVWAMGSMAGQQNKDFGGQVG